MTIKGALTPLENIRDKDGNTHPWYMSGIANIDDSGHIRMTTHLESHIAFSGFTGGMMVAFLNSAGQAVYTTPVMQYGVDGYDVPSWLGGTPSPRTVNTDVQVDPAIYSQTEKISIFLFHAGKNRLGTIIEKALPVVTTIVDWIVQLFGAKDSSTVVSHTSSALASDADSRENVRKRTGR